MKIDDHFMCVLVGAFKSAAGKRLMLPDGTLSEEVHIEAGIKNVIATYENLKPKPRQVMDHTIE